MKQYRYKQNICSENKINASVPQLKTSIFSKTVVKNSTLKYSYTLSTNENKSVHVNISRPVLHTNQSCILCTARLSTIPTTLKSCFGCRASRSSKKQSCNLPILTPPPR